MESILDGVAVNVAHSLCRLAERQPEVRQIPAISQAISAQENGEPVTNTETLWQIVEELLLQPSTTLAVRVLLSHWT
eukprot:1175721-Prorocentrum_minimum.AAC.2